ncbi:uncharacterized protein LOC132534971 [Erinaceus europaeus]|uniref:Uncharacterized protein LOC132534971 n=1 Tax=Erinaceus europaeus TaxID=9365 RepID=A0ABM3WGY2_ERIEU|nr:uncharacterized protein LOC132534971 [Erinaceus europaeus]
MKYDFINSKVLTCWNKSEDPDLSTSQVCSARTLICGNSAQHITVRSDRTSVGLEACGGSFHPLSGCRRGRVPVLRERLLLISSPATTCMVCQKFKKGHCLLGKGSCTAEVGQGCRTRDFFIFWDKGNSTECEAQLSCQELLLSPGALLGITECQCLPLPVGWFLNNTEMDCFDYCSPMSFYFEGLKISTFCCKGQDFCNRYQGQSSQWKPK